MDTDWLRELIEQAACREVREYSGRGMNGRQCIGTVTVDGERWLTVLADLVAECQDTDEAAALLRKCRTDDMGRETIVYWPSAKLEGE